MAMYLEQPLIDINMSNQQLENTLTAIDDVNSQDPNLIVYDGINQAKELIYVSKWVHAWINIGQMLTNFYK